jgi:hypothetical protein
MDVESPVSDKDSSESLMRGLPGSSPDKGGRLQRMATKIIQNPRGRQPFKLVAKTIVVIGNFLQLLCKIRIILQQCARKNFNLCVTRNEKCN